jgi:transcriptional regulator with XRE-family HTH domain
LAKLKPSSESQDIMPIVGKRLRELRENAGLSQQELADLTGISKRQLGRYEQSKGEPSGDALVRIAKRLGVSVDYLLGLVDTPGGNWDGLTPDERTWLARLRNLPEAIRDAILAIVFRDH